MSTPTYSRHDEARAAAQLALLRGGTPSVSSINSMNPPSTSLHRFPSSSSQNAISPEATTSSSPEISSTSKTKKPAAKSRPSFESLQGAKASTSTSAKAADDAQDGKARKRRRVVVACDTCRRKKVKCQGLPNLSNTCNNCSAYNYRCTFTSEPDRSRGRYEILESKVETLLSALRSVAPHVAQQFEKGQLNITGPSGASAPPQNANVWGVMHGAGGGGEYDQLNNQNDADEGDYAFGKDRSVSMQGMGGDGTDSRRWSQNKLGKDEAKREGDRDMLLPDVEDGRPRYFGRSSTMTLLHSMPSGKDSRPSSPGPNSRGASVAQIGDSYETSRRPYPSEAARSAYEIGKSVRFAQTARPMFPTNSKQWIQLLRRKNTVAVGRDDPSTEEWFTRYTLPSKDLVADLLDLYFERLSPLMPIVHRPSLERDIELGRADKDSAFRGFVFTILAIASRFSNDPRVYADAGDPDTAGDHYAAASRLYHQVYAASLINVQVMILTATFMHGSIGPGASWTVLGVAIRALQDIGLHQERAYRDFTPFDQELRRRVFWGAFILDCIFTVNMGRPSAIRLSDCDVKLPLEVDDDSLFQAESGGPINTRPTGKPIVTSGFIHMIKLNVLVGDIVQTLYAPRWRQEVGSKKMPHTGRIKQAPEYKDMAMLSKRLDEWVAETPEHLRSLESPFKLQAGIVQCGTHDIRLYILKPFLNHSALRKMLHPQCSYHARECLKVVIELYEGAHVTDLVFIFQQAFMSTATFMITVWHECREAEKLAEDNNLIEATLRTFASFDDRYFSKIFRRAHRILRDIATRTIHTMNSDQRERVSQLLHGMGQQLPVMLPASLMGASAPGRHSGPSPRGGSRRHSTDLLNEMGSGIPASSSEAGGASIIPSWSPWGPGAMSPARGSVDYQDGLPNYSAGGEGDVKMAAAQTWNNNDKSAVHPNSFGDARDIMPFFTPNADDAGAVQHQLEDLIWTDYFSKFLDDIGGSNTAVTAAAAGGQTVSSNDMS